jgi:hypothetical protein
MDIIKKTMAALVLLLIVVLAWIGSAIYFQNTSVDINPNADSYTNQLRKEFDISELDIISERTEESFPVSPEEFLSLIGRD